MKRLAALVVTVSAWRWARGFTIVHGCLGCDSRRGPCVAYCGRDLSDADEKDSPINCPLCLLVKGRRP